MPANTGVSRNLWSDLKLRGGLGFDFSFCQRILSSLSYIKEFYSSRVLSFFPYRCFLLTQLHGFGSFCVGFSGFWLLEFSQSSQTVRARPSVEAVYRPSDRKTHAQYGSTRGVYSLMVPRGSQRLTVVSHHSSRPWAGVDSGQRCFSQSL